MARPVSRLNWLDWTALVIVVVGALNWGLVGFFNFDLVGAIFGDAVTGAPPLAILPRIIFAIVGLAGLYSIYSLFKISSMQARAMPREERERMRRAA